MSRSHHIPNDDFLMNTFSGFIAHSNFRCFSLLFSSCFLRWVHVVCALYVPGVAFGDIDKLRPVTLTEMNYSKYGAKASILFIGFMLPVINRLPKIHGKESFPRVF